MCKTVENFARSYAEDYAKDMKEEARQEGLQEGLQQERLESIQRMIKKGCSREFILDLDYSKEEIEEAEKAMSLQV